ncbi:MAG TPA: ribonuclease HI family protein [Gaiellales bacterium]
MTKGVRRAGKTLKDAERRRLGKARRAARAAEAPDAPPGAATLWCDGGSRGNPGPAACGFVLEAADGRQLASVGAPIGRATVAVAEYRALVAGLGVALAEGLEAVEVRTDSRLVVAQMTGEAPVRSRAVKPLHAEARDLAMRIGTVGFRWVPAEQNGAADALVAALLNG